MNSNASQIHKPSGGTSTEQLLERLCERTFLNLWSWPRPFKDDRKELCDLIAIFEDRIIVFFDRESRKFDKPGCDVDLTWKRWKKEAVDKQISTAIGATKYLASGRDIYLDDRLSAKLPVLIPQGPRIHRVVVAHGAKEACKQASDDNVTGSLAVSYGGSEDFEQPFFVPLSRSEPVHLFDSENLELVFGELDTFADFIAYLDEKEAAIRAHEYLSYCGEEDLLAHYFSNFDEATQSYRIGLPKENVNGLHIGEGDWQAFRVSAPYQKRQEANRPSYLWDRLIQKTGTNALKGVLGGNGDVFQRQSAIYEMAKEGRLARRMFSTRILQAISSFPETSEPRVRQLSFMQSGDQQKGYVFFQLKTEGFPSYEEYREARQVLLELACGVARNKFPSLKNVVGIAVEPPRFNRTISEDFILINCESWSVEQATRYREANQGIGLFESSVLQAYQGRTADFPLKDNASFTKIGANERCPCGSGVKFKKCHGRRS